MTATITPRVGIEHREHLRRDSIFRCSECGSFLDVARANPETGSLARKCMSCLAWYPIAGLRWEGSD